MPGPSKNGHQTAPKERDGKGRFAAGNRSGRGRLRGSRNKVTLALEAIGEEHAENLWRWTISRAANGDMQAMGLALARIYPMPRGRRVHFNLPTIKTAQDTVEATSALLAAVARGELSPEEAQSVAALIDGVRKAIETQDHELRIAQLEAMQQQKGR